MSPHLSFPDPLPEHVQEAENADLRRKVKKLERRLQKLEAIQQQIASAQILQWRREIAQEVFEEMGFFQEEHEEDSQGE